MEEGILFGGIGTILGCFIPRKKYGYSVLKALFYSLWVVGLGAVQCRIMSVAQGYLLNLISNGAVEAENGIRFIGVLIFEPVIILPLVFLSGEKYRKIMDFAAPGNFAALMIGKISCHLQGCCYGIPFENGIYNKHIDCNVFPVQLCESVTSLIAIGFIYYLLYRGKNIRKGSLFPIGCIVYSITRIFWEEFRYYKTEWELEFFFGLNTWQFWCVISIVISVIWLLILYLNPKYAECDFETKENSPFEKSEKWLAEKWHYLKHRNDKNIVHHKKRKKK